MRKSDSRSSTCKDEYVRSDVWLVTLMPVHFSCHAVSGKVALFSTSTDNMIFGTPENDVSHCH